MPKKARLQPEDYESRFLYSKLRLDHVNQSIVLTTLGQKCSCDTELINKLFLFIWWPVHQEVQRLNYLLFCRICQLILPPSVIALLQRKHWISKKDCLERSPGCLGHSTGPWWRQQREGQKRSQSRSLWTALNHPFPENTFVNLFLTFVSSSSLTTSKS